MDLDVILLSEASQADREKYHIMFLICGIKKKIQLDLFVKEKQAHGHREETCCGQGGGGQRGMGGGFAISRFKRCIICRCCSVAQSCPTLCDPMDRSSPGFPVLHHLPEVPQAPVHRVGDAIPAPITMHHSFHLQIPNSCSVRWVAHTVTNPLADAGDAGGSRFDPRVGKIPWRRRWPPSPVLLPGKSHGFSLEG